MATCVEQAADTSHLPYETEEENYRSESRQRYQAIRDDATDRITSTDVTTGGFAGAMATWVATRQRSQGLYPSQTTPDSGGDLQWFDNHALKSYKSGREYARKEIREAGYTPGTTGIDRGPHRRAVTHLYDRQREQWRDLATDLRDEVRTTLRTQLNQGATAREARDVVTDRIEKVGFDRARRIAQTEPAWGFNRAYVAEVEDAGIARLAVDMSWETAGDNRVCADCRARSGTYPTEEAVSMMQSGNGIPEHTLCRCRWRVA